VAVKDAMEYIVPVVPVALGTSFPQKASSGESCTVYVLPGLKARASTPRDGSAVAPVGPRPFLPALNGGVPRAFLVDVLPGLKARASTPRDGSAVAPVGPRPFLPALNGGVPRAFLMGCPHSFRMWKPHRPRLMTAR
jgi:hypothetical protein